jgi:hypothetical protein
MYKMGDMLVKKCATCSKIPIFASRFVKQNT